MDYKARESEAIVRVERLTWEPQSLVSPGDLEEIAFELTDGNGNVSILENGTLLFIKKSEDDEVLAEGLAGDLNQLVNFTVVPVDVGGFLVEFHPSVAVYVGGEEFKSRRAEILDRLSDLCVPGEVFQMSNETPEDHALIGVYARGKLRRDANDFRFHRRI